MKFTVTIVDDAHDIDPSDKAYCRRFAQEIFDDLLKADYEVESVTPDFNED